MVALTSSKDRASYFPCRALSILPGVRWDCFSRLPSGRTLGGRHGGRPTAFFAFCIFLFLSSVFSECLLCQRPMRTPLLFLLLQHPAHSILRTHVLHMASSSSWPGDERRLLRGVLSEAMEAQSRTRYALQQQLKRSSPSPSQEAPRDQETEKKRLKALRRAETIPLRLAEVSAAEDQLAELQRRLREAGGAAEAIATLRSDMEVIGLGSKIESFDLDKYDDSIKPWGSPDGFDGLVVHSPQHGIPILVSKQRHSDEVLRRVSRGTDIWFQVREGKGSRVLLRTSMCRGLKKAPRECMEEAAAYAAFFSDGHGSKSSRRRAARGDSEEPVEVMWTDSRHVAKRGGRVGQLKDGKKLGIIRAEPWSVREEAREAQEEQGWL